MNTLIKLSLIFLISLLSFSVGTYVGKKISDKEYKETASNEEYKTLKNKELKNQPMNQKNMGEEKREREIASLAKEFIEAEKKKEMKNKEALKPIQEEKSETLIKKEGYKPLSYSSTKNKTSKTNQKNSKPLVEQKVSSLLEGNTKFKKNLNFTKKFIHKKEKNDLNSIEKMKKFPFSKQANYTIQVASYANQSEAEKHVAKLKEKNYSAFFIPAKVKEKTWYRVNVGLYPTKKKAQDFQKELKTEASITSSIITKIKSSTNKKLSSKIKK